MTYHYSEKFLNTLNVSNIEVANQLLDIFNDAFIGFENSNLNSNKLYIQFCHYDKNGVKQGKSTLFIVEPNLVQFYETGILEINEIDSLINRIIRNCDLSYSERDTFNDQLRITIEKYALKDFVETIIKDYINQNSSIVEQLNYQIVVDPQAAQLYINDQPVETVNGVYNNQGKAGTEIKIKIDMQGYHIIEDSFILNNGIQKKYILQPIYTKFHLAINPCDANIKLYKSNNLEIMPLSDATSDQNIDLSDLEEIELNKYDDMYCQDLKLYDQFIIYASKRLYKPYTYAFTNLDNIYKVINLEQYKVHVTINLDPIYDNAHVSINGKSVDVFPYEMDCAVGEYLEIDAFTDDGMRYSNFVIINESDIANGLIFNITFTHTYQLDISVTNDNARLYVNSQLVGQCYSGEFIEDSVVDIRVELEGYIPINERILIKNNISKTYTLNELIPRIPVTISVSPDDSLLSINGIPVLNPYISEVYENSTLSIRAIKDGYYSYNEKFVVNQSVNKNIVLTELPEQNVSVNIDCNIENIICYINDQLFSVPGTLIVEKGAQIKIDAFKDGYKNYQKQFVIDQDQDILIEMIPISEPTTVLLTLNINKSNALVMVNSKQIDPIDENCRIYEINIQKDAVADVLVTLTGYSPYRERFICNENIVKNIYLEKDPELEMYKLQVYVQNSGATLQINGVVEASPFIRSYRSRAPINIKCKLDGFRTFEQNLIMTKDAIVPIILDKLISIKPMN